MSAGREYILCVKEYEFPQKVILTLTALGQF